MILKTPILAVTVLLAAGCSGLGQKEQDLLERGEAALESGDLEEAELLFGNVVQAAPRYGRAWFLRGRARFESGRFPLALEDFDAAELRGNLKDDERMQCVLYRGRCWIEAGKEVFPDASFRSTSTASDERKKARDCFLKANRILSEVVPLPPYSYEFSLWRGHAMLRLENYRKALEFFESCAKLSPARWEHRFLAALAQEGIYNFNSQSLETYFAILGARPRPEHAPVVEHLIALSPEVSDAVVSRIFGAVEAYAAAVPAPSETVVQFLKEKRSRRESQKRQERLAEIATRVGVLTAKGSHREAVALVSGFIKESGEDPEAVRLLRETQESWSTLLEARSEERVSSGDRDKLEEAIKSLEQARTLTSKVERLVVLQQKLSSIQLALSRQDTSRKIQRTYDLLKSGKHQEVLDQLASTNLDGLSDRDRDLFHYLRGAASFSLGQWTAAAKSFSFLVQRNFENLDVLHGLALVRSGQETAGMAILVNIPPEGRTDEVNRVLGFNFAERGEYSKAVVHLAALKNPTPADLEMLLKTRRELGADAYRHNEYARAAEEFQAARQIIEVQLHRRAADVYLYLGNSYYRLDDFERAKKAYQDLGNMDLTASERDQMKELFLFRGQIRLREKNPDAAYQDFSEFVRLGGQLPADVVNIYGRLVATYANYMPLEKIHYWNYTSTAKDYNYTLVVKEGSGGQYSVERREGGNASTEVWSRQGITLAKKVGDSVVKMPINLKPAEDALPFLTYTSQGQDCTAEIVAIGQTVELPGGKKYTDCLKLRLNRSQKSPDGSVRSRRHILYLAPNVGEVRQEIFWDDKKVSEIILSDFAFRSASLGN